MMSIQCHSDSGGWILKSYIGGLAACIRDTRNNSREINRISLLYISDEFSGTCSLLPCYVEVEISVS